MTWLLRGIAAFALVVAVTQTAAIVIQEQAPKVAEVQPSPSPKPSEPQDRSPPPSVEPSPPESVVPSPEATPVPSEEPPVIAVNPPAQPVAAPATPPPVPRCTGPGGSDNSSGNHTGWSAQGRECAGKQDSTPLLVAFLALMLLWKITDRHSSAPCLICKRGADDPLHGPPFGTIAHENVVPRIEQHPYDPGERRRLIRRMADRIHILKDIDGTR